MSIKTNLVVVSTHLKNISQIWIIFPGTSGFENKKYLSCHHLENQPLLFKSFPTLQNHHLLWLQHDILHARQNVGNQIIPSNGSTFPCCNFYGIFLGSAKPLGVRNVPPECSHVIFWVPTNPDLFKFNPRNCDVEMHLTAQGRHLRSTIDTCQGRRDEWYFFFEDLTKKT